MKMGGIKRFTHLPIWLFSICVVISLLVFVKPVSSQSPDPSDQVHSIAKMLNCPTCGGRNLADCPTDTCTQWKDEIRSQLNSGKTSEQVIEYFKTRFGPTVLQEPPKEGPILLLWVTPVVILLAILIAGIVVLRRTSMSRITAKSNLEVSSKPVDSYITRLEDEVAR